MISCSYLAHTIDLSMACKPYSLSLRPTPVIFTLYTTTFPPEFVLSAFRKGRAAPPTKRMHTRLVVIPIKLVGRASFSPSLRREREREWEQKKEEKKHPLCFSLSTVTGYLIIHQPHHHRICNLNFYPFLSFFLFFASTIASFLSLYTFVAYCTLRDCFKYIAHSWI